LKSNTFKNFLVVYLIVNWCKKGTQSTSSPKLKRAHRALFNR
jgi:hypothetical protein